MSDKFQSVVYGDYLQLNKILGAQSLRSDELGAPAHDEMLFIIVHQTYELWFKQIIHEIKSISELMTGLVNDERPLSVAVSRLRRINEIMKVMIEQVRIIETITPLDFLDFRNFLVPASGFQSFQFRKVELMLGLRGEQRMTYNNKAYNSVFNAEQQAELDAIEATDSVYTTIEKWLERTPFLNTPNFDFSKEYISAVKIMVDAEKAELAASPNITEESKTIRYRMLDETMNYINNSLDAEAHQKAREVGEVKISHKALLAALMINLYRDEPVLRNPFNLIHGICELDEMFTMWRYRHSQMVLRVIGRKMGTGGSIGYDYLKKTAEQHRIFSELNNISTLMIPRSNLPELPTALKEKLDFAYKVI